MKKLILSIMMIFSLTGCAAYENYQEKKEQEGEKTSTTMENPLTTLVEEVSNLGKDTIRYSVGL